MRCPRVNYFAPQNFIISEAGYNKWFGKEIIMAITVRDLWLYDPNFDQKKIQYLTGKRDFKKNDTVTLSRVAGLNDKDLSVFVAQKEGKSFVNSIRDDNMRAQIAEASGVGSTKQDKNNKNNKNNVPQVIPMDKSVFDINNQRKKEVV